MKPDWYGNWGPDPLILSILRVFSFKQNCIRLMSPDPIMTFALTMALALLLDWLFGWPQWLYARIGHPVTWIGRLISELQTRLNRPGPARGRRMLAGAIASLFVVAVCAGVALVLQMMLPDGLSGVVLGAVLAWPLLAARSLHDHVADVRQPLAAGNIERARAAVSMIVGRDPTTLDEAGIARSAIESLAENTSDGVMAPLFWGGGCCSACPVSLRTKL